MQQITPAEHHKQPSELEATFKHNLPAPLTSLIGREREMATVQQLLHHPQVRLLTLTGPGGVGKTRLAVQIATDLSHNFADGVSFVSLAPISEPDLVTSTVAQVLGLREEGKRPLLDRLKLHLRDKQMLLLLDNFEQVVAAAPLVVDLLAACPQLKTLVTSREVLHVQGEHEFSVPLLTLPDLQRMGQLKAGLASVLAKNMAVSLFVERAQAVKPDFQLSDENAAAIAEICTRLDGLPLAIELAAARIKLFSPQTMLARLGGVAGHPSLQLLTGGTRDMPARQRTLQRTIQWSYDLLTASEQQLLHQLSIFVGGFTLTAAEAICADLRWGVEADSIVNRKSKIQNVLDGVASLIDKSLLQPVTLKQPDSEPRFTMLVTICEFVTDQLERRGEISAIQKAHAAYYINLAESAAPKLKGPEQEMWLEWLELEHDNLRAALSRALERDEVETASRLGNALCRFWLLRGYLSEGNRWLTLILDKAKLLPLSTAVKAKALHAAGVLAMYQSDFRRAEACCSESLALFRQLGDKEGIAAALQGLAQVAMRMGQFTPARTMREESLALFRQLGDQWGIANALVYLGLIDWMQGDYMAARPRFEEGLARYRAVGDPQGIAQALQSLSWVTLSLDDPTAARALIEESLAICRAMRDRAGTARSLTALGMIVLQQNDPAKASALLEEALPILIELGDKFHFAAGLGTMTALAAATGRLAQAVRLYSATDTLMTALGAAVPAYFRASIERSLVVARAQLDEAAFAVALDEGRTMTLEQILAMQPLAPKRPHVEPVTSADNYPAGLTEREVEVLRLLAQGLTNAQIASQLIVSPFTINAHLRHIFNKLDVPSRAAATRYAIEHNLI